jgi:hypothetical protein
MFSGVLIGGRSAAKRKNILNFCCFGWFFQRKKRSEDKCIKGIIG